MSAVFSLFSLLFSLLDKWNSRTFEMEGIFFSTNISHKCFFEGDVWKTNKWKETFITPMVPSSDNRNKNSE